ncbi:DUF1840 domain-containing protein [Lampropedia aestuarii]|nr:DUF1840 domain-containing protein [Lampropedia aestuarii]
MIKFTAHSSAPIQYLNADAKHLLRIIGKDDSSAQGIITEEQLPAALQALEQAIEREEAAPEAGTGSPQHLPEHASDHNPHAHDADDKDGPAQASVSLRKRALPFQQLLRQAQQDKEFVVWQA